MSSSLRTRAFVHRQPTDLRLHFNGLWGLVCEGIKADPFTGDHYVFIARSRKRIKVLTWDGTGVRVLCKRLDRGLFIAPWRHSGTGPVVLTPSELELLLEGCEQVGRIALSPEHWTPVQFEPV